MLDFLAYLEFERGLSRNTLEAYRSDLLQFGHFLVRNGLDATTLGHADLARFLSELAAGGPQRPPVAPATIQRKAACLRSFYRHLRREEIIAHDPTAELRSPRKNLKLPQVLSRDEVARLLARAARQRPRRAARPRAARAHVRLRPARVRGRRPQGRRRRPARRRPARRGKGSKERLVPVGREAVAAARAYLELGRPGLVGLRDERHLFVNHRGGGLTRQGLYKIVQRHARAAGLDAR